MGRKLGIVGREKFLRKGNGACICNGSSFQSSISRIVLLRTQGGAFHTYMWSDYYQTPDWGLARMVLEKSVNIMDKEVY